MRNRTLLVGAMAAAFVAPLSPAAAQGGTDLPGDERASRRPGAAASAGDARNVLGMTLSFSGTERDTLGMLVSAVAPGSPADEAGVARGNRLAAVGDADLRLDPADVAQRDAEEEVVRRLARELRDRRPGDEVRLALFAGTRRRALTVRTADAPPRATARRAAPPAAAPPATLDEVVEALGRVQTQLRRLAEEGGSGPLVDTLAEAERDAGALRLRLRAALVEQQRRAAGRAEGGEDLAAGVLPGLRVTAVAEELADYFGEGSERGLLVLQADASWAPLRAGDVILRIDGRPADAARLRDALDPRRESSVELMRRQRLMLVTLHREE